jgi:hypothetical protein
MALVGAQAVANNTNMPRMANSASYRMFSNGALPRIVGIESPPNG